MESTTRAFSASDSDDEPLASSIPLARRTAITSRASAPSAMLPFGRSASPKDVKPRLAAPQPTRQASGSTSDIHAPSSHARSHSKVGSAHSGRSGPTQDGEQQSNKSNNKTASTSTASTSTAAMRLTTSSGAGKDVTLPAKLELGFKSARGAQMKHELATVGKDAEHLLEFVLASGKLAPYDTVETKQGTKTHTSLTVVLTLKKKTDPRYQRQLTMSAAMPRDAAEEPKVAKRAELALQFEILKVFFDPESAYPEFRQIILPSWNASTSTTKHKMSVELLFANYKEKHPWAKVKKLKPSFKSLGTADFLLTVNELKDDLRHGLNRRAGVGSAAGEYDGFGVWKGDFLVDLKQCFRGVSAFLEGNAEYYDLALSAFRHIKTTAERGSAGYEALALIESVVEKWDGTNKAIEVEWARKGRPKPRPKTLSSGSSALGKLSFRKSSESTSKPAIDSSSTTISPVSLVVPLPPDASSSSTAHASSRKPDVVKLASAKRPRESATSAEPSTFMTPKVASTSGNSTPCEQPASSVSAPKKPDLEPIATSSVRTADPRRRPQGSPPLSPLLPPLPSQSQITSVERTNSPQPMTLETRSSSSRSGSVSPAVGMATVTGILASVPPASAQSVPISPSSSIGPPSTTSRLSPNPPPPSRRDFPPAQKVGSAPPSRHASPLPNQSSSSRSSVVPRKRTHSPSVPPELEASPPPPKRLFSAARALETAGLSTASLPLPGSVAHNERERVRPNTTVRRSSLASPPPRSSPRSSVAPPAPNLPSLSRTVPPTPEATPEVESRSQRYPDLISDSDFFLSSVIHGPSEFEYPLKEWSWFGEEDVVMRLKAPIGDDAGLKEHELPMRLFVRFSVEEEEDPTYGRKWGIVNLAVNDQAMPCFSVGQPIWPVQFYPVADNLTVGDNHFRLSRNPNHVLPPSLVFTFELRTFFSDSWARAQVGHLADSDSLLDEMYSARMQECIQNAEKREVSVEDPLSGRLIETPVRGMDCRHLETFDLDSYFQHNKSRGEWLCPLCHVSAPPFQLRKCAWTTEFRHNPETAEYTQILVEVDEAADVKPVLEQQEMEDVKPVIRSEVVALI